MIPSISPALFYASPAGRGRPDRQLQTLLDDEAATLDSLRHQFHKSGAIFLRELPHAKRMLGSGACAETQIKRVLPPQRYQFVRRDAVNNGAA